MWAGGAGPALAGWVAKKTRAGSSLRAKVFFFFFSFFVAEPVWRCMGVGWDTGRPRHDTCLSEPQISWWQKQVTVNGDGVLTPNNSP